MNCRQTRKQLDERLDGRLDEVRAAAFDAHIVSCPVCRARWQEYARAWETLARQEGIEPSFGFATRTLHRLDEPFPESHPAFGRPVLRWLAVSSAVIAVGVAGLIGWQRARDTKRAVAYANAQQADLLEDFDVITSLDQLENGDKHL